MKRSILPILALTLGIVFTWYKILFQVPLGEGYYYFDPGQNFFGNVHLYNYDNLPRLIFDILPPLFGDNLVLYQGFQLLSLILLSITIYFVVNYFFKNKWLSFMTTFLFSISYVGLFEMIATGNYQRFIQRIPNFIFLFIAFYYLAKYFKTKNIRHYFTSIVIFGLTVFMAHYSTFLLPLFLIFPIITKPSLKSLLISASYFLVNYFFIKNDFYNPGLSASSIIPTDKNFIDLILLQLSSITYPPTFLSAIAQITQPYTKTIKLLSIPIIIIYVIGIYLIKKREPKYLVFYLTSLLTLFSILFLNFHIGKINLLSFARGDRYYFISIEMLSKLGVGFVGGNRYYVLPLIFNSIIFSSIFWVILKSKRKLFYLLSALLLAFYLIYNTKLIWKEIDQIQPVSNRMRVYLNDAKLISPELRTAREIVTPREFIWSAQFVRFFYGNPDLKFIPKQ